MRIALVIFRHQPQRGGAERYTADLATALVRRGHQVRVLTAVSDQPPHDYEVVTLDAAGLTRGRRYVRFLDALDAHLRRQVYDVVHAMLPVRHCDIYHPHAGIEADTLASDHRRGGRLVASFRWLGNRLNFKRRRFVAVERRLLSGPRPPVVLCLSHYVRQALSRHYALGEERMVNLFNGVDLEQFDPSRGTEARRDIRTRYHIPQEATVALMLAQDPVRKGLPQAIEALARLDDKSVYLLAAGGFDPYGMESLAQWHKVADRVIFTGATRRPAEMYSAADFLVLPTRHDPCSLVVLEALAMGLPVITSRRNGAAEAMVDGQHGYVLENHADVAALSIAMRAMTHPQRRAEMSQACLALRPALSQEQHVQRLLEIYQSVQGP